MGRKFISWRRVSTGKQAKSGLGLEAQKSIIKYFVDYEKGVLIADYEECHTGTSLSTCTELKKAMEQCKRDNAILIIAKVDRFRTVVEALQILDYMGEGNIMFCDLPTSDRFSLTLYTALAEREALITSIRTKQALAVKKAQGCKMGAANEIYRLNYKNKTEEEKAKVQSAKGTSKRNGHHASKDVQGFIKVVRKEFKQLKSDNPSEWNWSIVNCKRPHLNNMLERMQEYQMFDSSLFERWDFNAPNVEQKFRSYMQAFKKSYYSVC